MPGGVDRMPYLPKAHGKKVLIVSRPTGYIRWITHFLPPAKTSHYTVREAKIISDSKASGSAGQAISICLCHLSKIDRALIIVPDSQI